MAQQAPLENSPADLRWYIAIARRHKFLITAVTGLVVAATLLFTMQQTPMYTATAKVLVRDVGVNSYMFKSAPVVMPDEQGVASSETIARVVMEKTGLPGPPASLLDGLVVTSDPDSSFLMFNYSSPDPATAQRMSQAFAQAYLDNRNKEASDLAKTTSQPIRDELQQLGKEIAALSLRISRTKMDDPNWAQLNASIGNALQRKTWLQQTLVPFDTFTADGGSIVTDASRPTAPSSPSYPRNLLLALVMGLFVGAGASLVRERLDDRLRGTRDLDQAIGAPILATIPKVSDWKHRERVVMITSVSPRGPVAEAYRTLRTNLQFVAKDEDFKIITVTSPAAGEGKTTTVANLAATMAQTGKRVIAVSCDLRKPRLHGFFGLSNEVGLSNILEGKATLADAVQTPESIGTLRLIASGPVPVNPAELLGSPAMTEFLRELRFHADFILLDAPPVLAVSDPLILGPQSDGVLLIADAQTTARSAAAHSREQLEQVGCNIIGCVLNNFDPNQIRYYPYQNAYYYSSYYSGYKGYKGYGGYGADGQQESAEPQPRDRARGSNGQKSEVKTDDEMWLS